MLFINLKAREQNNYNMQELEMTESLVQEEDKNEFLDEALIYENCPHCQRNFFLGKLTYHLKLCKPHNPMTKSPLRKKKRTYLLTALQNPQPTQNQSKRQTQILCLPSQNKHKKCQFCNATYPLAMIERHSLKCNFKPNIEINPQIMSNNKLKSQTRINFGYKKTAKQSESALPRIRNSAKEPKHHQRKNHTQDLKELGNYSVRIREDLSCFKKAIQVQQIECTFCSRKFSREASLRHIPICQKLKSQQIHQIALKKHSKSQVYRLNIPEKKSTLFRAKFISNLKQKSGQMEIKSARVFQTQRHDRQKVNTTSMAVKIIKQKIQKSQQMKVAGQSKKQISIVKRISNKQQENEQKKKMTIEARKESMDMTFSKNFNKSSSIFKHKQQENMQTQFNDEIMRINDKYSSVESEQSPQLINQFLQVSPGKQGFFPEVKLEQMKVSEAQNEEESCLKGIKLAINLRDVSSNIESHIKDELDSYSQDFQA